MWVPEDVEAALGTAHGGEEGLVPDRVGSTQRRGEGLASFDTREREREQPGRR